MVKELRYDILFSMEITPSNLAGGFTIIPTGSCIKKMTGKGLIFKNIEGKAFILTEKKVDSLGNAEPLREITKPEDFDFVVQLRAPSLLSTVKPFDQPVEGFSNSVLYVDNLSGNIIDAQDELSTGATIGLIDFSRIVPNRFSLPVANTNQVRVDYVSTQSNQELHVISPGQQTLNLNLENGAYQLTKTGGVNSSERVFVSTEIYASKPFGLIRVFKKPPVDYSTSVHYKIPFEII